MAIKSTISQPPLKLDMHDKKIIFYLSQDSRIPRKELARKLNISIANLHYKIARLEKELISPAPNINYPLLKIPSYIILTQQISQETKEKLLNTSKFWFFNQAIGKYQYVMNVITDDIESFCKEYLGQCSFEVHPIIRYIPDDYNPWKLNIQANPIKNDKIIQLDDKDYRLLSYICENTTSSILEISAKTHMDRNNIKERIKKMLNANIIQKFRYAINVFKMNHLVYIINISMPPSIKNKIIPNLRSDNYSGFIFETLTGCVMYYMPPTHKELFNFTNNIQEIDQRIKIEVIQTTEIFRVDLVPQSAINIFKEKSKKNNQQ